MIMLPSIHLVGRLKTIASDFEKNEIVKEVGVLHTSTAYMVLLMIFKTLNDKKRLRSMLSATGGRAEAADGLSLLISTSDLAAIPMAVAGLPRLKMVLITSILEYTDPISVHAKSIIQNCSASVYSFVVEMMESEIITALHISNTYLMQILKFWDNHCKLKNQ